MKTRFLIILSSFILIISQSAYSQLRKEHKARIDSLFLEWNQPDHPGGSVGVLQNGKLVYSEAFGLASLEYLVPNTYGTQYNIASVSKQFTAFGIVLMDIQGKLSVDDDIRKHLPELPEFDHQITIRHMLHHTSGLRSLHAMLQLAGWRSDDMRNNDDLLRFMIRQKDLNFKPGDEYLYCNTGYILMAEIIERISGEDFAIWMKREVFDPLGMYNSYIEDKYNRVVKNNATSYDHTNDGFLREVEYWGYTGSGNMHSNVADLLIWLRNLRDPGSEWKQAFEMLQTTDNLNNGDPLDYAFGVTVADYKGDKRISHGGSIGGFRSFICTFPDVDLDIVILSNFSSSNTGSKANSISDIILNNEKNTSTRHARGNDENNVNDRNIILSEKEIQELVGDYYSEELFTLYNISEREGQLYVYHTRHGEFKITSRDKDEFEGSLSLFRDIKISRDKNGNVNGLFVTNGRVRNLWFDKLH